MLSVPVTAMVGDDGTILHKVLGTQIATKEEKNSPRKGFPSIENLFQPRSTASVSHSDINDKTVESKSTPTRANTVWKIPDLKFNMQRTTAVKLTLTNRLRHESIKTIVRPNPIRLEPGSKMTQIPSFISGKTFPSTENHSQPATFAKTWRHIRASNPCLEIPDPEREDLLSRPTIGHYPMGNSKEDNLTPARNVVL